MQPDAAIAECIFIAHTGVNCKFFVVQHSEDPEILQNGFCLPGWNQKARSQS